MLLSKPQKAVSLEDNEELLFPSRRPNIVPKYQKKKREESKSTTHVCWPYQVIAAFHNYTHQLEKQGQAKVQNYFGLILYQPCNVKRGQVSAMFYGLVASNTEKAIISTHDFLPLPLPLPTRKGMFKDTTYNKKTF